MTRPKVRNPKTGQMFVGQQPAGQSQVALNPQAFNELIHAHGIRMIHSRPMPCPRRLDITAADHDPSCNECHNGFLYYGDREFFGVMMGNDQNRQYQMNGTWDTSTSQILVPSKYADGKPFDLQLFDQIEIPDFSVRYYQLVEHSQMGIDKLHFPAVLVDKLIDANGREYHPGKDFFVNDKGYIQWSLGGDRPGYNLDIDRGVIYSVNYYTKASFTVISLPHQMRVTQTMLEGGHGAQEIFPQLAVVRKDFMPHDPADKVGSSDRPEPRDGQF
jgi:hypothetical protein